jgi:hypothetical protein
MRGFRGRDRMVVRFTATYTICAYLSPLMLWVRFPLRARCTTLCDKVSKWLAAVRWFSPGTPVSSTNKTDHHVITEILLNVALSTIKPSHKPTIFLWWCFFVFVFIFVCFVGVCFCFVFLYCGFHYVYISHLTLSR